jgi:hypothetical protein
MRVHTSVLIQRPIATVFGYLSTPGRVPCWVSGVATAYGPLPDELGVGATLELANITSLGTIRSSWEVTAYEPPRSLALRGLDGARGVEVRWTLEGTPSGATRVWIESDLLAIGFFHPAASQVQELGVGRLQEDLDALRRRLEDGEIDKCNGRAPPDWRGGAV